MPWRSCNAKLLSYGHPTTWEEAIMEWRRLSDSLVAGCALVIVLWVPAQAQYGGGSGTADDPYLICTPQQMNAIGADPNDWDKHFKLMADLDLSAYTGTEFNVIGHEQKAFTGVFDGNHHRIRKFTYRAEDANYVGFFGRVGFFSGRAELTTTIKDLGLIDPNVDAGGGEYIGALVGHFRDARILHCYVRGGYVSGRRYVGALIGGTVPEPMLSYTSSLEIGNCYATCSVSGDESVGGLVGFYGSSCAAPPFNSATFAPTRVDDASVLQRWSGRGTQTDGGFDRQWPGSTGYQQNRR